MRSKARSSIFSSTVLSLSGRKLQRRAHACSPRRRSTLAGCTDSGGIRQGSAPIHSRATASRRSCAGSTPSAPAPAPVSSALALLETGAVLTSVLARPCAVESMRQGGGRGRGSLAEVPLSSFSPQVRAWFERAFAGPTPAQAKAWPAIAAGEHVLVSAPTGSGKTLAAFLWALDRLAAPRAEGSRGTRVVYVSPLKALAYDIERNLRAPLRGIGAEDGRVGIRTGDTPQRERAAMARNPPDIRVTTPESLYLILTARARDMLCSVEAVIVDEIHAVAHSKRGAHLALTLERLAAPVPAQGGARAGDVQRIGLSATQSPREEIGRFLVGPTRKVTIIDAGARKELDLRIEVPVESMTEPSAGLDPAAEEIGALAGGESTRNSIWPAIYPELLAQVRAHNSTIIFVNSRRAAERVALRLNELAESEIARAHHGSLAREERTKVEELLKAGELPCLVATSSLELGIDMGAVDLVLQIESPKSVARGLQRIGRAGHGVDQVSRGRIFPKFRGDLLECAVVARRMHEGLIEPTVVPRNALDVLAQQIVAIAVASEPATAAGSSSSAPAGDGAHGEPAQGGVSVDELHALVRRTHTYSELSRELLENVLDMLDGRYPSKEFGELRARIVWDRVAGTIRARRGSPRASSRSPTPARSPTAVSTPSRCPTAAASASSTRRWSMRRARGRRSCSAPPAGGSRK